MLQHSALVPEQGMTSDESDAASLRVLLSLMGIVASTPVTFCMPAPFHAAKWFPHSSTHMPAAHVVVEVTDVDNREIFYLVGKDMVETVVAHDVMGRLMIQCSLQAGLSHVLRELISFEGCEIYGTIFFGFWLSCL